jgi:eukaryotic-like serine/threonine-protein kinase
VSGEDGAPPDPHADATIARRSVRSRAPRTSAPPSHSGIRRPGLTAPGERTSRSPHTTRGSSTGSATDSAVLEAMLAEEATRAHGFAGVIAAVCAGVLSALPLLNGDPLAKTMCAVALAAMTAASLWVFRATRDGSNTARYTRSMHRAYGWVLVCGVLFVEYYCGFFSPATVVLTLGVYYFGQSTDRGYSFLLPLWVITSFALLAGLTAAGVLEDRGLFRASDVAMSSLVFAIAAASGVLLITLRMARVSRRALREAIERSNEALLIAQRREIQLAEAHHQLDHALRAAVGKPGRYTGELAGDYRLGLVIGMGAIGEVYAGEHIGGGERVAVKLLQAAALAREDLVERILREGEISRSLDSPHIVRVLDVGRMSDGAPYLAMELLEGRDLAARLRHEGQLALPELATLAEQLGVGLAHAHAAGVVHRDLKPLNIYEALEHGVPRWKILDFGISKLASSSGTLTREGIIGTPGYMSPEQAKGTSVDHRSDVFSFALVLYRAMTGQPAFPGEGAPQILFDIVYKMPKRPSSVIKGLPSDIDLVMAIALAKEPADRFQSAAEFAAAFALACMRKLPTEVRARGSATSRAYPWDKTLVVPASGGMTG